MENFNKRLIASWVAGISIAVMFSSYIPYAIKNTTHKNTIRDLDEQQKNVYLNYMETDEFSGIVDKQIIELADDYTSGRIDHKQFRKRLNVMFTVENAKQSLSTSNNELKAQAVDIDKLKQYENEKYDKSIIPELSVGGIVAGGSSALISGITVGAFTVVDNIEKSKKYKQKSNNLNY